MIIKILNLLIEEGYNLQDSFNRNAIESGCYGFGSGASEKEFRHIEEYGMTSKEKKLKEFDETRDQRRRDFLNTYQIHI